MNCEEIKNLLNLYLEGKLSEDERTTVENHLTECKNCNFEYQILGAIENTLKTSERLEAPVYLKERILTEIFPTPVVIPKKEKIEIGFLSIAWTVVSMILALVLIPFEKLGPLMSGLFNSASKVLNRINIYNEDLLDKAADSFLISMEPEFLYFVAFAFILLIMATIIFSIEFSLRQKN